MNIESLRKRDETHHKARVLGATADEIARYDQVARAVGPRTTLPNGEMYDAIWAVGLHALTQGRPLIPTNAEDWAGELWILLCNLHIIRFWDVVPLSEIRQTAVVVWSEL